MHSTTTRLNTLQEMVQTTNKVYTKILISATRLCQEINLALHERKDFEPC